MISLAEHRVLLLDCQTTGASPAHGSLLEIAWCLTTAQASPVEQIKSHLVSQPEGKSIPMRIQILTGIAPEQMSDAKEPSVVCEQLRELIASNNISHCIIHYSQFEKAFLNDLFAQFGGCESLPFELICTYQIARRLYPNLPTRSLRGMAGYFGATTGELKRSACHVEATWWIWQGLASELAARSITDFSQLKEWLMTEQPKKRAKYEYPLDRIRRLKLPDAPGVYRMQNKMGVVLYVGKATSLKSRVNSYFRGQKKKDAKTKELLTQVFDIQYTECQSAVEAALLETDEIKRLNPPYNISLKEGRRAIVFYSKDFTSMSKQQDNEHKIGPFAGETVLEPILRLHRSLASGQFDPHIFFEGISAAKLAEGFKLFSATYDVEPLHLQGVRDILAVGMWMYRREKLDQRAQAKLEAERAMAESAPEAGQSASQSQSPEEESGPEPEPIYADDDDDDLLADEDEFYFEPYLSIEGICERFAHIFVRAAAVYLKSKRLTSFLNQRVSFSERGKTRTLIVKEGTISEDLADMTIYEASTPSSLPWEGLDIRTYDRMRVLATELARIKS
jgi:DNA polymerase-3 subunit epsilon